jgi:hypothetical protein
MEENRKIFEINMAEDELKESQIIQSRWMILKVMQSVRSLFSIHLKSGKESENSACRIKSTRNLSTRLQGKILGDV